MKFWKGVIKIASISLLVLMFTLLIFSIARYETVKGWSQQFILGYGLFAIFVLSLFFDLFPQYLSAHLLILIAADLARNNLFLVSIVVLGATLLASIAGFSIGRYLEEKFFIDVFGKEIYAKIGAEMKDKGKWYAALSAVSPLPYIPILFGALNMKWKDFVIWGIIPRLLGFIATSIFAAIVF